MAVSISVTVLMARNLARACALASHSLMIKNTAPSLSIRLSHEGPRYFTAKPLPLKARGCDEGATPGIQEKTHNLEEVASDWDAWVRQPLRGWLILETIPKVALVSLGQPWAAIGNGFAVKTIVPSSL